MSPVVNRNEQALLLSARVCSAGVRAVLMMIRGRMIDADKQKDHQRFCPLEKKVC